jgi:dihydroneopterin aldolase
LGNTFLVDVTLHYHSAKTPVLSLDETINYEKVFSMVEASMKKPTPLLETVVTTLALQLQHAFPRIQSGKISITKCAPPISGWNGNVAVEYAW